MTKPLPKAFRERLAAERQRRLKSVGFSAAALCFAQQLAFVTDAARWVVACCSRRAGKTVACAIRLLLSALAHPDSLNLYLTLSRVSGKRIVWRTLTKLNQVHALGGIVNRSDLTITFPNGATIIVGGAKDETEIEKYRGPAYQTIVIDEAQSFREYLGQLIDDVLVPATIETKGTIVLIGTPGKVKAGYFFDALRAGASELQRKQLGLEAANDNGEDDAEEQAWAVHHWTLRDNPHIPDVEDELARIRRRRRWTEDSPTYQREYLGRWVSEHEALVWKYDVDRNGYDPAQAPDVSGPQWRFIHFVDQGYNDADAVGTLAWRHDQPWVWLLPDEVVARRQTSGELAEVARVRWEHPTYKGRAVAMVWDEGGGGKKVAEDVRRRFAIPVTAAEKPEKVAGVEWVNTLLVRGVLRIPRNSQAAVDAARVTWDPKARGVKFSQRYHTDIWDGILYGCRALPTNAVIDIDTWTAAQAPVADIDRERAERDARIKARARANHVPPTVRKLLR